MTSTKTPRDDPYKDQPVISGPHALFDGSFTVEFLKVPASLNASCLLRTTTKPSHPLILSLNRKHPLNPPLHLHFSQDESFLMVQGREGFVTGYSCDEKICSPEDGVITIPAWTPHYPFIVADENATEDAVMYMWAHPDEGQQGENIDNQFFESLFKLLDEAHRSGSMPNLLEMMVVQHPTASSMVIFPTCWFLGPLRWWIPYMLQSGMAAVGRMMGYKPLPVRFFKKD